MKPQDRPNNRTQRAPNPATRHWRFLAGMIYLVGISLVMSEATDRSFINVFFLISISTTTLFFVLLVLVARWVTASQSQRWQLNLGSLLLMIFGLSVYFGTMRWLVVDPLSQNGSRSSSSWANVLVLSALYCIYSLPFILFLGESIMWFAAWLVQRRVIRAILVLLLRLGMRK